MLREVGVTRRERPPTPEGARAFRLALEELGTLLAALADELEAHLSAELDLVEEAHGAEVVARVVDDFEHLLVPAV